MMKPIFLVVALSFLQSQAFALNGTLEYYIQKQLNRAEHENYKKLNRVAEDTQAIYKQKIDHFNVGDTQTFDQRYFINTQFAENKASPVIYVICGEGTCDGAATMSAVNETAKKLKANLIALEHRYYGYSQPFPTLASENLKYLSMDQAIEDLATFQMYAQKTLGFTGKWVSVGGSYPGELSAFYRLKHPELVSGALASSGPVLAKANFWEYDRHVARVAGPACLTAIQSAVAEVEQKLKDPVTSAEVRKVFGSEVVKDDVDFLYVLADMAAIAIQYGYQTQFCNALVQGQANGTVVKAYAEIGLKLFNAFGITPLQDSFQGAESIDPKDYLGFAGMRSWMYQSCTEFGFYQVANSNPAESSRSARISLPYHNDVCNRLFGLTTPVDDQKTNAKYYNQLFNASVTNILLTNGSNDPWSNLSITPENPGPSANAGLAVTVIEGSAHCDDLGGRTSPALVQAKEQFATLAQKWVTEVAPTPSIREARIKARKAKRAARTAARSVLQ